MSALPTLPGDAFAVNQVLTSWQKPGTNRAILRSVKGQLWERVAESAEKPRARRAGAPRRGSATARTRRGRGTGVYGGAFFGYHRDSNGVIAAGVARFPLRAR